MAHGRRTAIVRMMTVTVTLALGAAPWVSVSALTIRIVDGGGVAPGSNAWRGFQAAADIWEAALFDDVVVNIRANYNASLASGVLGSTALAQTYYDYAAVRNALSADATSSVDNSVVSRLQPGASLKLVTNNASGAVVYDADGSTNNRRLALSRANAKALGLAADNGNPDAWVTLNSKVTYDFNRGNGIQGWDFIGVAAHEIGHALGFMSGVDVVDALRSVGVSGNGYAMVTALDLLRFSSRSLAYGPGVIDMATGGTPYLSDNGGTTNRGAFSTGRIYGDGREASHWKQGAADLMKPSLSAGQRQDPTAKDFRAFDAIGWDRTAPAGEGSLLDAQGPLLPAVSPPALLAAATEPPPAAALVVFAMLFAAIGAKQRRRCRAYRAAPVSR